MRKMTRTFEEAYDAGIVAEAGGDYRKLVDLYIEDTMETVHSSWTGELFETLIEEQRRVGKAA